jgi:RNA polymerase sigma-70 factor (ECF subfamily)
LGNDTSPRDETDEALMAALAAGSHAAFEELLTRYETALITFCYSFTRERQSAEDMAQETFLRVFRNAARYKPIARFSTWLYKIAANLCINELKKGKLRPKVSLQETLGGDPDGSKLLSRLASGQEAPLTEVEQQEASRLIHDAIQLLPDDQRTTLVLVEYHHMPYQEIADVLGVTVSAIKMRVKRARETLRHTLRFLESESPAKP